MAQLKMVSLHRWENKGPNVRSQSVTACIESEDQGISNIFRRDDRVDQAAGGSMLRIEFLVIGCANSIHFFK